MIIAMRGLSARCHLLRALHSPIGVLSSTHMAAAISLRHHFAEADFGFY